MAGDYNLANLPVGMSSAIGAGSSNWGGTVNAQNVGDFGACLHTWWPAPTYHYTFCTCGQHGKRPLEQAFAVASMLIQEGLVKEMTVAEFVDLVNKLKEEL